MPSVMSAPRMMSVPIASTTFTTFIFLLVWLLMFRPYLSAQGAQFFKGPVCFPGLEGFGMPQVIVLHKVHALAGNRVRDHASRFFIDRARLVHGSDDLLEAVAIDLQHVPVE